MNKDLLELFGLILGDGTYYLDKGKYSHMIFFNYDLNLINRVKRICEGVAKRKIKISCRSRKNGKEYSFCIPTVITKKLLKIGFNKKKLPETIIHDKNSVFLLKGFFEADGTVNGSQIHMHQKNGEEILRACKGVANSNGLSAHIHNLNREGEQYLAIEDVDKIKRLFGKTAKKLKHFEHKIRGYHVTKRIILRFLNDNEWKETSEIRKYLEENGIKLSKQSNALTNKHLNKLWKLGLLEKRKSITMTDERGRFIKTECKWKLKHSLTKEQILNFPYGVLK